MDVDYQLLGNHEFNHGREHLEHIIKKLNSKTLNANIIDTESNEPFLGQAYDIIKVDDLSIGIIGLTTAFVPHWEPKENYHHLTFVDPLLVLEKHIKQLKDKVDYLIVAYHGGVEGDLDTLEYNDMTPGENQGLEILKNFPDVDLLITGHQHLTLNQKLGDTLLIQTGSQGSYLFEITIQKDTNGLLQTECTIHEVPLIPKTEKQWPFVTPKSQKTLHDWATQALTHIPTVKNLPQTHIEASLSNHLFYELHNQVQQQVGQADFSLTPVPNDAFNHFVGRITNESLLKSFPFYNKIATLLITGNELIDMMEYNLAVFNIEDNNIHFNYDFTTPYKHHYHFFSFSGFECEADLSAPVYQRVRRVIDSSTHDLLIPDKEYTLAVSIYHAVSDHGIPHLSEDKIIRISEHDSFYYMQEKLQMMDKKAWNTLQTNYTHLKFKQ